MEKKHVKNIVKSLGSSSNCRILDALLEIKKKIISKECDIKILRDCGGLEQLVALLKNPSERILDVNLSVLANCCTDEDISLAVGALNVSSALVGFLKSKKRDSILGRTCRVMGNLAVNLPNAVYLHECGAVAPLLNLIKCPEGDVSLATVTLAVRVIRLLWMVTERREDMLNLQTVKVVAGLMEGECELAQVIRPVSVGREKEKPRRSCPKTRAEFFAGVVKCLGYFTTLTSDACLNQIQGDGRGYKCLVALAKEHTSALQCLVNICLAPQQRVQLGCDGIAEVLVEILGTKPVQDWPAGAAQLLALLSQEAVNRSRLRYAGALTLMMPAAAHDSHVACALACYAFDDEGLQILVKGGLIPFLVDKLHKYLETMTDGHEYNNPGSKTQRCSGSECSYTDLRTMLAPFPMIYSSSRSLFGIEDDDVAYRRPPAEEEAPDPERTVEKHPFGIEKNDWIIKRQFGTEENNVGQSKYLLTVDDFLDCTDTVQENDDADSDTEAPAVRCSPATQKRNISVASSTSSAQYPATWKKARGGDWSPESGVGGSCNASPPWRPPDSSPPHSAAGTSGHEDENSDSEESGRYSPVCSEPDEEEPQSYQQAPLVEDNTVREASVQSEGNQAGASREQSPPSRASTPGADGEGAGDGAGGRDLETYLKIYLNDSFGGLVVDKFRIVSYPIPRKDRRRLNSHDPMADTLLLLQQISRGPFPLAIFMHEADFVAAKSRIGLLVTDRFLKTLVAFMEKYRYPHNMVCCILLKIIKYRPSLVPVLRSGILHRIILMFSSPRHNIQGCRQCRELREIAFMLLSNLASVAESDYGVGEICRHLRQGSTLFRKTLAVSIPYLTTSMPLLKLFYVHHNALDIIMGDLENCAVALSQFAHCINIRNPRELHLDRMNRSHICDLDRSTDCTDDTVTFELDDGSTVTAGKTFVCEKSEYFKAMFAGSFKESNENHVHLQKVSKEALNYLLILLDYNDADPSVRFPLASDLEICLEVLLLTDRFLLDKIQEWLYSAIICLQMRHCNVDEIYIWSLETGMGFLCVESVAFALLEQMKEIDRCRIFVSIMKTKYKQQWLDDIKNMIMRQLV